MSPNYIFAVDRDGWMVCERSTDLAEEPYPVYIMLTRHRTKEAAEQYVLLLEHATEQACQQRRAHYKKERDV